MDNKKVFKTIVSALRYELEQNPRFHCGRYEHGAFLWIATSDSEIGFPLCHYEVRLCNENEDENFDEGFIFVEIHFENGNGNNNNSNLSTDLAKIVQANKKGPCLLQEVPNQNILNAYKWYRLPCGAIPLSEVLEDVGKIVTALENLDNAVGKAAKDALTSKLCLDK